MTENTEQKIPSKEEIIKNITEQIEIRSKQVELQRLNAELSTFRFKELEANYNISKIIEASSPKNDGKYQEHILTQEDFDRDPNLAQQGFKVGQTVVIPVENLKQEVSPEEKEPAKKSLKVVKETK